MRIIKESLNLYVCFSVKELAELLLKKDFHELMDIALNNSIIDVQIKVNELSSKQSKLRDSSELWTAIFSLSKEFNESCEICFLLKDSFNHNKDKISSFEKLIKFKKDPPDISILNDGNFYHFELKRYFELLNTNDLLEFVKSKILTLSEPYNFYITLRPEVDQKIEISIFKKLNESLKKMDLKRFNGVIAFSFNADNKYIVNIYVYPDFKMSRHRFKSGSEQIFNLIKDDTYYQKQCEPNNHEQ